MSRVGQTTDNTRRRPRVLSLSCVFPNPGEPSLGGFVRSRLQALREFADVRVVAPVAQADYSKPLTEWFHSSELPEQRDEGGLTVYHPKWLYPPLGGMANPALLARQIQPLLERVRREFAFDLIDAHFAYPDGIAAARLAGHFGVPFQVTLRGNETLHGQHEGKRRLMQKALGEAARVISVSESLRQYALGLGVEERRTRTIPNGVNADLFYPRDREECRRRFNLASDELVIVSAGTLIERKGHHLIAEALPQLQGQGRRVTLAIAGGRGREGNFESQLHATIERVGVQESVRLLGQLDPPELAGWMTAADLFCLASSREGWPNVVHEAMACGAPVVATSVGGVPDMLPSNEYGFIVEPGDQAGLVRAIDKALARDWRREEITRWAHARSWRNVAAEVLEEVRGALSGEFSR